MDTVKILIADDHKLVRQGLMDFLNTRGEFSIVGEAETGEEAVTMTIKTNPDLIIMDLNMPKMNGIEAIQEVKKVLPDTKIIVLSAFTQDEMVFPAIDAGADGYLLKDIKPDELVTAIHSVMAGKPSLHPEITKKLMMNISVKKKVNKTETLTTRENEVLQLISDGKSNEEIANELSISILTVKTHVHNILAKLNVTKRVQAALFAASQPDILDNK
jgi:DNA-binding NarL/FixJ family response regulator